ncbi:hypothetical protein ACET3X_004655 [Alternaria dauci]|uniref:Uncharacterized protein n=1 Tax=Alternaria dauci TaxID=48095 RepID=A0ABR3UR10_9PLEO
MSDQDASMPDLAEESTVEFATAAAYPLENPLAGPANEIQRQIMQILPSVLEVVLKDQLADFLQQSLATIETKVQESMSPILTGFKAEVNRLDKTADRMDTGRVSAPKRSLDSIMPKIAIKLQGKDFDKMQGMTKKQILRSLHGLPHPACRAIRVARLRVGQRDLILETDSWPAYQELSKPSIIADMTQKLDLDNLGSTMKHEVFWVVLTEWSFEQGYLDKCQSHIEEWKENTGLKIKKVKYENGRLLWGFAEASHAIQACSKPLFFSGDRAIAMSAPCILLHHFYPN